MNYIDNKDVNKLIHTEINWRRTSQNRYLLEARIDGIAVMLRLNDFPDEPICTVIVGGCEYNLEEFPALWTLPRHRGEET